MDNQNQFEKYEIQPTDQGGIQADTVNARKMKASCYMPAVMQEILEVLDIWHPDMLMNNKMNIVLVKLAQMVSFKGICSKKMEDITLANHFAINLMGSGRGKDKSCKDLDKRIFNLVHLHFQELIKNYKMQKEKDIEIEAIEKISGENCQTQRDAYIQKKLSELRNMVLELNQATAEGFFADAKVISEAKFGSLFVKLSEFGLFLLNKNENQTLFFDRLYEAYDGDISSKAIKYGERENSLKDVPVNALLHSNYTLFKGSIKDLFEMLMTMGFVRRAIISFQEQKPLRKPLPAKALRAKAKSATLKAQEISNRLLTIFLKISDNAIYEFSDSSYDNVFYPYLVKIIDLHNANLDNDILSQEIYSRTLKVQKIAGMFACLNHPTDLTINEADVEQAISVVEKLSEDFKRFQDYKPHKKDGYDLLEQFFIDNLNMSFKKTELVNKYRDFGFKREKLRDSFDSVMDDISEIVSEKGYILNRKSINNNTGIEITLIEQPHEQELSEDTLPLEVLINTDFEKMPTASCCN